MRATAIEYKHRYLVHGLIYTLGFAAPWHLPVWAFLRNESTWFLVTDGVTKPTFENFAPLWNSLCGVALAFAVGGALLRTWGAAYLGASTVHQGGMEGDRVIANGPYRYLRNPLYLGTILNTVALSLLMRPEAAVLTIILITVVQFRLIAREEPYLLQQRGAAYDAYASQVPRLLPRFTPAATAANAKPNWQQGVLSEIYVIGVAISFGVLGWTRGFAWEASVWHVMQGIIVALGVSVVARAFIPKSQM